MRDPEFYRLQFRERLATAKAYDFQRFVGDIFKAHFHADYLRSQEFVADGGIDGRLLHRGTAYSMYGPDKSKTGPEIAAKMRGDFRKAIERWPTMTGWVFVHNQRTFGSLAQEALADLADCHPQLRIEQWGPEELWRIVAQLPDDDVGALLGYRPEVAPSLRRPAFLDGLAYTPLGKQLRDRARESGDALLRVSVLTIFIALPIWLAKGWRSDFMRINDLRWFWFIPDGVLITPWMIWLIAAVLAWRVEPRAWRRATWLANVLRKRTERWVGFSERAYALHARMIFGALGFPIMSFGLYQATSMTVIEAIVTPICAPMVVYGLTQNPRQHA